MQRSNAEFKTLIDTIEVSTDINNLQDFTIVNNDRYKFLDRVKDDFDKSEMKLKLNTHTKYGEGNIDKLYKHNEVINEMLMEIGIVNANDVNLSRIDIAFDTNSYDFDKDFKKLLFIFELLTIRSKKSSKWYTTNLNTLKANSIKLYERTFELEIYNKKEESNNTHPYNVRVEFRYKRRSLDVNEGSKYIDKTIDDIKGLEGHLEQLEKNMSDRLLQLWEVEKDTVLSFSEFVRRYNRYFYTLNILKNVYKGTGLKGSYSKWLEKFRRTNILEFYTKSDIKEMQKAMIRSAKDYLKAPKKAKGTKEINVATDDDLIKEIMEL